MIERIQHLVMLQMRRLVLCLAGLAVALAVGVVFFGFHPWGIGSVRTIETIPFVVGMGVLGGVLIAIERGYHKVAWVGLGPALLGLVALVENQLGLASGLEAAITAVFISGDIPTTGHMPLVAAITLVLIGAFLPWIVFPSAATRRLFALATGSALLGAFGITTITGYALDLKVANQWGSSTGLPPVVVAIMLLIGCAALVLDWAEHRQRKSTPPIWLPIPVMIICGMFTIILWAGMREGETAYLVSNTQFAINAFSGTINAEFTRQAANLEPMARRWMVDDDASVWESDAATWMNDSPGAHAIALIAPDGSTVWYYPLAGNEHLVAFNQLRVAERRSTLAAITVSGNALATSTVVIDGHGSGFIMFTPIYRTGVLVGFIGAEFTYQRFFEVLDSRLKLSPSYYCAVYQGDDCLYTSLNGAPSAAASPLVLESLVTLQNRSLRIVMEPSAGYVRANRHFIPELSLVAGFGITLLLGLSIHLARTARASLVAVETTNHLLRSENEERRRIQAMLKLSDERLRLALDATVIGIFEWDCRANTLHFSSSLWAMIGRPEGAEFTTPEEWQALIHPDDLPAYLDTLQSQINGAQSFIEPEYRVCTVTGSWRWIYMRSKTVSYSESGHPLTIVGTVQDVTARRETEEALRGSQAAARKLSLVASRTDNPVFIMTPDGTIEWVNDSFERVTEYSSAEVVGRNPTSFMTGPETNLATLRRIRIALILGRGISSDIVIYSKSGRKYHLQLEIQPILSTDGVVENFIAIESDITARVETEAALRLAKAEADSASRAKSEFLAAMSHEIRTPMNGVIGMTGLLLESPLSAEQRDSVNVIRTSGEVLLAIINDLLDFSKIESGNLELDQQPFELGACIEETLDLFAAQAAIQRLEVAYFIDPAVPAVVEGDVNRIRQILSNLVNNAVKFTPAGGINITVRLADTTATLPPLRLNHIRLSVAVSDSGIGIPRESLDRLFKPFSQVDASTTRKYGGTGLGLAICQRLCALMGGQIGVVSERDQGSTFTFTIQVTPATVSAPVMLEALASSVVLCIDDNPVNLARLRAFFQGNGVLVITVADAQAAHAQLTTQRPVAVVVDLELPDAPATTELYATLASAGIPIIGQLPYVGFNLPAWTAQARFESVSRPLRTQALLRAVNSLFGLTASVQSTGASVQSLRLAEQIPLRVLLVEDNIVNQRVALRSLDHLGYHASVVSNGKEAVDALADHAYQLVFMDLQMPEMDGFEATRIIRKTIPGERQPFIIALTANALQDDREQCLAAGMNDFITKPIRLADLDAVIRRNFPRAGSA